MQSFYLPHIDDILKILAFICPKNEIFPEFGEINLGKTESLTGSENDEKYFENYYRI